MYVKVAVIQCKWQTWGKYFGNYLLTYYYLLLIKIDMDTATNFLRKKFHKFLLQVMKFPPLGNNAGPKLHRHFFMCEGSKLKFG